MNSTADQLQLVAKACDDKQAKNITALKMSDISSVADYFLICHASNERQVQAIARHIKEEMSEEDIIINRIEGLDKGRWVLVDLGNIICHIFHEEERLYYNLERLWGDAERVPLAFELSE